MIRSPFVLGALRVASCLILALGFTVVHGQQSANLFDAARIVLPTTDPIFQRLIDLDSDGSPDAVGMRGGFGTSELRLYRNLGDGSFTSVWSHVVNWPHQAADTANPLVVGDFDGDGLDDDFALSAGNELRLFLGSGLFASPQPPIVLLEPVIDLDVKDLDHDGTDDLILSGAAYLGLLMNPLTPALSASFDTLSSPPNTEELLAVRLNSGATSLVVGNDHFRYQPGVGLVRDTNWSATLLLGAAAIAGDVDGDGDEDGALFTTTGQYQLLLQDANSNLIPTAMLFGGPATEFVDLDGDGDLDGVGHGNGCFELAENDGSGAFASAEIIRGYLASRLAGATDLDGDGDVDLLAGHAVYYASGSPLDRSGGVGTQQGSFATRFLDIDADGDLDAGFSLASVHLNDGTGRFLETTPSIAGTPPPGTVTSVTLGDWNRDGAPDFAATVGTSVYPAWNQGGGHFLWGPTPIATGNAANAFATGHRLVDLEYDGDLDVVGSTLSPFFGATEIAFNDGTGDLNTSVTLSGFKCVGTADFDFDGLVDLLLAPHGTFGGPAAGMAWSRQLPGQTFATPINLTTSLVQTDFPLLADLDGDGDIDILTMIRGTGHILLTNDGSANFTQSLFVANANIGPGLMSYGLVDVDGDGNEDLILSPATGAPNCSEIFLNTPAGFVTTNHIYAFTPLHCGDLDGDGDGDVYDTTRFSSHHNLLDTSAARWQYGSGTAGTQGLIPVLGASGPFGPGDTLSFHLRNVAGAAPCYFAFSAFPAELADYPVTGVVSYLDPLAATTLLWPVQIAGGTAGVAGTGGVDLSFTVPNGIAGVELHQQVFMLDPAGPSGIASSQALGIRFGL